MTNPPNIDAIIAELSEATGPSREADCRIWLLVGAALGGPWQLRGNAPIRPGEIIQGRWMGSAMKKWPEPDNIAQTAANYNVPAFTGSLDAAMTLVPEGLSFEVRRSGTGDQGQATIWDPMTQPGLPSHKQWRVTGCATPALALCIAALRVRSALIGEVGRDG